MLSDLLDAIAARGRGLFGLGAGRGSDRNLADLGRDLLSRRGEASGIALAQELLQGFAEAAAADRLAFLEALADAFGADRAAVDDAVEAYRVAPGPETLERIHQAAEPRRQELIRRMNTAPGGTAALIRMREALMEAMPDNPGLASVDGDFVHLFSSWFNRGFLMLRPIDWNTPASILEKLIRYEAVHAINGWDDLKSRLGPPDRRCYGYFHPRLPDDPLIFVEVALTREIPDRIAPILEPDRQPIAPETATTAVFYSISNTQRGLTGVSFGHFLIKQVVEDLRRELPGLKTFVTLSPVPRFARWLVAERAAEVSSLDPAVLAALEPLAVPGWHEDEAVVEAVREPFLAAAAFYFLEARDHLGRVPDPIARFHLGNGAWLERLDMLGDRSPKAMEQAHGLMVNYLYDPQKIEANHEAFAERGEVIASSPVRKALRRGTAANRTLARANRSKP